jgi:hypothetical protein
MNAQTTLTAAIAAGFDGLSTRDLMLCALYGAGGAGGNFAGSGAPTTQVPVGSSGTYWDYTNGILYMWNPVSKTWTQ